MGILECFGLPSKRDNIITYAATQGTAVPKFRGSIPQQTVYNFSLLRDSVLSRLFTYEQLLAFAALPSVQSYVPDQVIYNSGQVVDSKALFYVIEGSVRACKHVERSESNSCLLTEQAPSSRRSFTLPTHTTANANTEAMNQMDLAPRRKLARKASRISSGIGRWTDELPLDADSNSITEVFLRKISKCEWFGYCSMLGMLVRQTSVKAIEHTRCLVFDEERLQAFFSEFSGTAIIIREQIAGQSVMQELRQAAFLNHMNKELAALLCALCQPVHVPANTILFAEGDPPSKLMCLYYMVSGSAVMYQTMADGGHHIVRTIENADCFGEACCLFSLPRVASVRVTRASVVMQITAQSLGKVIKYTPGISINTRNAYNSTSIATQHLLNNRVIADFFRRFCETEHSCENQEFWVAARAFRLSNLRNKDLIAGDAQRLYALYVDPAADKQVNLLGTTREKIEQALRHQIINKLTFEEAEEEILHLLDRDSFSRFKNSDLFQECLMVCREK